MLMRDIFGVVNGIHFWFLNFELKSRVQHKKPTGPYTHPITTKLGKDSEQYLTYVNTLLIYFLKLSLCF